MNEKHGGANRFSTIAAVRKDRIFLGHILVFLLLFIAVGCVLLKEDGLSHVTGTQFAYVTEKDFAEVPGRAAAAAPVFLNAGKGFRYSIYADNASDGEKVLVVRLDRGDSMRNEQNEYRLLPGRNVLMGDFAYEIEKDEKPVAALVISLPESRETSIAAEAVSLGEIRVTRMDTAHYKKNMAAYLVMAFTYSLALFAFLVSLIQFIRHLDRESMLCGMFTACLTVILFILIHMPGHWDFFHEPFLVAGTDEIHFLTVIKNALQGGDFWYMKNMNAPYGASRYSFPMLMTGLYIFSRFMGLFTRNAAFVSNLYYFLTYLLSAELFVWLGGRLKIGRKLLYAGSVVFTFSLYHICRSTLHMTAASYFVVPVMLYFCFRIMCSDEDELISGIRDHWQYYIFGCFVCASVDIFYAYFGCGLVALSMLLALFRGRKKAFCFGVGLLFLIMLFGGVNLLPAVLYKVVAGSTGNKTVRSPYEAFFFGLMLVHMFFPQPGTIHPFLMKLRDEYFRWGFFDSEAVYNYIGLIGAAGLICLYLGLLSKDLMRKMSGGDADKEDKLRLMAALQSGVFLLGTCSGLGPIIALEGFTMVRTYNRVFVYILCIAAMGAMLILDLHLKKKNVNPRFISVLSAALILVHLLDTQLWVTAQNLETRKYRSENLREYTQAVEQSGARQILMLPYVTYPENLTENGKANYLYQGYPYVFSDVLKTSLGAGQNSADAERNRRMFSMEDMGKLLVNAAAMGYDGISFDTGICLEPEEKLRALTEALGKEADFTDRDREHFFFRLPDEERTAGLLTSANAEALPKTAEGTNLLSEESALISGWHAPEDWAGTETRWAGTGEKSVVRFTPKSPVYRLRITVVSAISDQVLTLYIDGAEAGTYPLKNGTNEIITNYIQDDDDGSPDGEVEMKLQHGKCFVPAETGRGDDKRKLTAAYQTITVEYAD